MRCKKGSTLRDVVSFAESDKKSANFKYEGMTLYLVRVKSKGPEKNIFITNLDPSKFSVKDIGILYRWRWDVENSFREFTESLSLEQWHRDEYNNILQEVFARLWLFNATKILRSSRDNIRHNPTSNTYKKVNFKFCAEWFVRNFEDVLDAAGGIFKKFVQVIKISKEKRIRYSRNYERQIKSLACPYKYNNTIMKVQGG